MTPPQFNGNIYVLVNNKPDLCMSCIPVKTPELLSNNKVKKLDYIEIGTIEYYMEYVNPNIIEVESSNNIIEVESSKTKEDQLLDSIHCNLSSRNTWVLNHLKSTIEYSSFTIFVNYGDLIYYPLAIATIDIITKIYTTESTGIDIIKKYLYINTMCVCKQYYGCGKQLMDNIKIIAKLWDYDKIVFSSTDNSHMLEWYEKQGFSEVKSNDKEACSVGYNYHFRIKK